MQKHDIFTCKNNMSSSQVKRLALLHVGYRKVDAFPSESEMVCYKFNWCL